MGCKQAKVERSIPNSWMELFVAMKLTKNDVMQLYKTFRKVDFDNSGSVDIVEMLTLLDVERTKFTEHVFTVFDSDGSGKIDFREFVLSVWNYCTVGQSSLDMFTFDLYDKDKSGKLSLEEVLVMVENLYGKNHLNDPKVRAMKIELCKMDETGDGISIAALKEFGRYHQALLYPVFKLQHHMQENILGVTFWRKASNRRIELCKGKYVTMSDLLYLHLDEGLYKRVVADSKNLNPKAALLVKSTGTANHRHSHDPSNIGPPPDDNFPSVPGVLPHFDNTPPPDHHSHHSGSHSHNHSAEHHHEHHPHHHGHHEHHGHDQAAHGHHEHHEHHNSNAHSAHNSSYPNLAQHANAHNNSSHGSAHGSTHGSTHGSSHGSGHHGSGHHGHHGAVLKNTAAADDHFHHTKKPHHATGHHHSDAKVHAAF